MKKIIALLLAVITALSLVPAAFADGEVIDETWTGEVISRQVSLYKEASGSSGSTRKVRTAKNSTSWKSRATGYTWLCPTKRLWTAMTTAGS